MSITDPTPPLDNGQRDRPLTRMLMQVLWPAFLGAAATSGLFFSAFHPEDMGSLLGFWPEDAMSAYTFGFFVLWVIFTATCALSYWLSSTQSSARVIDPKLR